MHLLFFLGVSVAITKPELEVFVTPIVKQMKILELGMAHEINNSLKVLHFFLLFGIFDKPARALVLNIISSNGYYGCLKCIQPGIMRTMCICINLWNRIHQVL
jgi:hypothetical protein